MTTLYIDTEVRAPFPGALDKLGLDNYARHPDTRLLLTSFAIDDGPERVWDCVHTSCMPDELYAALHSKGRIVAHYAQFDRVVLKYVLGYPLDGFGQVTWYCTRARANIHGLPGGLDDLSKIYKLGDDAKQDGKALIQLFCEKGADPDAHPLEWLQFIDYALHDISALRALYKKLPDWCFDEREQRMYALDQKINDRGFAVDLDLARKMLDASAKCRASLDARTEALSGGLIQKATQRAKVQEFIGGLPDMKAETLRKELRDNSGLSDTAREMISLRLLTAKSSTAKCLTALDTAGSDGRIRYTIQYCGGGRIGRFSHKGFQPGNLPRPERKAAVINDAIEALQLGWLDTIWGDEAQAVCADALRGLVIAAPGHKLLVADWSNIEGRKLAWYADEEWKLGAYRNKDLGKGEDLYKLLFHRMTGTPLAAITDFLRQQGKGADLSMGYGGGVGAFLNIANAYRLDLAELGRTAPRQVAPQYMSAGRKEWAWASKSGNTHDLPEAIYVACAALKYAYRDANPKIAGLWSDLESCFKGALSTPGHTFMAAHGKIAMKYAAEWLAIQLPSGRKIMFAKPRVDRTKTRNEDGSEYTQERITALKSPGWRREPIYGGLLANAITQGGCRDILVDSLLDLDAEGFPIVMHVHDDITCEVPEHDERLTLEQQTAIMLKPKSYAPGVPLAVQGFETKRLRKG